MSLELSGAIAERGVDVTLDLADGETVAVLGPNGAGKSTILGMLAGTLRPDTGHAVLDGDVLHDLGGGRSTWTPAHARGTALLAQEALLFPHLTALDNVAFGPRSAGAGRRSSRTTAEHWLAQVDATTLARRRPAQLSGGQAQRVALARALAAEPRLLLLDEPMAALDVTVVPAMRQILRRVLVGRSAIIVTHDVLDALLLADRVLVMEDGRVVEQGATRDVLTRPRSVFGARIAGLNLLRGRADADGVRLDDGALVSGLADTPVGAGASAVAVFSPASVSVFLEPPSGSPRNVFGATVLELEPRGAQVRVVTETISADVTLAAVAELDLAPGKDVHLVVKAAEVAVYPA